MERARCTHCRNPIKEHHLAVGPKDGDRTFHQDCWNLTHPGSAAPVTDRPDPAAAELPVELTNGHQPSREQRDYEQRIASGGLAALLSPYVSGLPAQRSGTESVPA